MTRKALFAAGDTKPARIIAADDLAFTDTAGMDVVDWDDAWGDGSGVQRIDGAIVPDMAVAWAALRAERDGRLAGTDWTQLPDAPLSAEQIGDWRTYRQQLRDLPESAPDPWNPLWPPRPDAA